MATESAETPRWRKSSYSGSGDCVEWAMDAQGVLVRDTKSPREGQLRFTKSEWRAFVAAVKSGEADLP